jgi:hypothetical protein
MSHPDLFALLRGELTNAEATAAGAHLAACSACRAELAELAVGNALLARAARILTETGRTPAPLPVVPSLRQRTPRRVPSVLVTAAAVVVGLAVGATAVFLVERSADESAPTAYASVALDPVEGSAAGEVRMVAESDQHTRMTIEAPDLPGVGTGHFYYAWLLDPETDKMLPLGQVGPGGTASFELDDSLLAAYSAVDVSLEDDDGDPGHSVTSVLRGTYTEAASPTTF